MGDYEKYRKFEKVLDVYGTSMAILSLSSFVIGLVAVISNSTAIINLFFVVLIMAFLIGIITLASMAIGILFGFFRLY